MDRVVSRIAFQFVICMRAYHQLSLTRFMVLHKHSRSVDKFVSPVVSDSFYGFARAL